MTEQKRFSGYETVVDLSIDAELTHVQKGLLVESILDVLFCIA